MKLIALAAMLALGGTAVAQTTPPQPIGQTTTPAPVNDPMTAAPTVPGAMGGPEEDPVGGYQPSTPALSGPVTPGTTVTVIPSRSPNEAYPAPAPLKHYPLCKKGQFDNCRQRGG